MALARPGVIDDPDVRKEIETRTRNSNSPADFFVDRLAEGIATIAAAFYPKPVIVRMSDFKTNEYAELLGGEWYEPTEANPMLGFRGAARYTHPAYRAGFALECRALLRVRNDMGLDNVTPMVPFCRRVDEAKAAIEEMAANGLRRGDNGLEIYVMCELPNNVISIDAFAEHFDGFSIGSNDLTQLALGVDRRLRAGRVRLRRSRAGGDGAVSTRHRRLQENREPLRVLRPGTIDKPEIARFLVQHGIDAMSLSPDAVIKTTVAVLELEDELGSENHTASAFTVSNGDGLHRLKRRRPSPSQTATAFTVSDGDGLHCLKRRRPSLSQTATAFTVSDGDGLRAEHHHRLRRQPEELPAHAPRRAAGRSRCARGCQPQAAHPQPRRRGERQRLALPRRRSVGPSVRARDLRRRRDRHGHTRPASRSGNPPSPPNS